MQYIGLKDKNGVEIYEGDIIKAEDEDEMTVSWHPELAGFCINRNGWLYPHFFGEAVDVDECEVIGNIYENPGG